MEFFNLKVALKLEKHVNHTKVPILQVVFERKKYLFLYGDKYKVVK